VRLLQVSADVADLLTRVGLPDLVASPVAAATVFISSLVVIYLLGRATITPTVTRLLAARDLDKHARRPLQKITSIAIVFVAIAVAFRLAGFGDLLRSMATIAAAATLAIGFAMQDVIANFVAGVFIYTDRPFRIGDWIEWDDQAGVVEDISLRVTRVRTFDNELLTVPNATLTDGVIKNPVAKDQLRIRTQFGIGYDDDIDEATEIILSEAADHPDILDEPAPSVRVVELGDSSVGLQARIWIDDPDRSKVVGTRAAYVQAVKEEFDAAGIDIPYPNRTIGGGLDLDGLDQLADQ
jgi:small-conductance mechanosensitive channel